MITYGPVEAQTNVIYSRSHCRCGPGYVVCFHGGEYHPQPLKPDEFLMLAGGLNIFRVVVPPSFVGKSIAESEIRSQTGCNVVAVCDREAMCINPEPSYRFIENNELILIGSEESESRFFKMHSEMRRIKAS